MLYSYAYSFLYSIQHSIATTSMLLYIIFYNILYSIFYTLFAFPVSFILKLSSIYLLTPLYVTLMHTQRCLYVPIVSAYTVQCAHAWF